MKELEDVREEYNEKTVMMRKEFEEKLKAKDDEITKMHGWC